MRRRGPRRRRRAAPRSCGPRSARRRRRRSAARRRGGSPGTRRDRAARRGPLAHRSRHTPRRGAVGRPSAGAAGRRRGSGARSRGRPCAATRRRARVTTAGAKLRIEPTPAATSRSATSWAARGGRRDHADRDLPLGHDAVEVVDRLDREVADAAPDLRRIGVDEGDDPEAAGAEAAVVRERVAEVADPDDRDRPVVGEAELARRSRRRARRRRSRRRGCRRSPGTRGPCAPWPRSRRRARRAAPTRWCRRLLGHLEQGPVVEGQPGDGGLGDPASLGDGRSSSASAGSRHQRSARSCTRSQSRPMPGTGPSAGRSLAWAMVTGLAFLATAVASLFAEATLVRYTQRRSAASTWRRGRSPSRCSRWRRRPSPSGVSTGWDNGTFRVFYLLGAVLNVPWLALGTVYLLAGAEVGPARRSWCLVFFSGLAAGVLLTAPMEPVSGTAIPVGQGRLRCVPARARRGRAAASAPS